MIKELSQFVQTLDPEFKALGVKPKEGLHILLNIQTDGERVFIDECATQYEYFTSKKHSGRLSEFLIKCKNIQALSWTLDYDKKPYYQKCFDIPEKGILSVSPFCFATKKKSLTGGSKFLKDEKKVYQRIERYFSNAGKLIVEKEGYLYQALLLNYLRDWNRFENFVMNLPKYDKLDEEEHIIVQLDIPVEYYQQSYSKYLDAYLFNNKKRFSNGIEEFGISNFFNGFNDSKPYLKHQTASFELSGLINRTVAQELFEFKTIVSRDILPRPLPIFIYQDELKTEGKKSIREASIALFKQDAEQGKRRGYKEIIEDLYKDYKDQLGNYYLLFYQAGEIKDFDFVPKFEYELKDENGAAWEIKDLFKIKYRRQIENVFDFQYAVLLPAFNNALIVKTKTGDFQHRYFDDIDAKYCKSDTTFLLVMTYRKAFYDFVYKSKREAVSQQTFDKIMLASILEDIRLDEFKNNLNSQNISIRQKLNIWFSLSENFNQLILTTETMASKLQAHRAYMKQLAKGEASIENDEQYAFAVGQVIYYLLRKSKTADRSYKRLEPFMQQVQSKELNKAIARLFDTYKHENFSTKFRTPFAEVLDYETKTNIRDLIPSILAGVFSENELFSDKENNEIKEIQNETEE